MRRRAGQRWPMAGRIRTAIIGLEPARAACHPSGPERSGGGAKRLETPPAEATRAFAGATVPHRLLGQRRRDGLGRVPVDQLLQLLTGREVGDVL